MAWTKKQKSLAVQACKAAGISEEQRRDLILRNFTNARDEEGRITSTAKRLNVRDFEHFMSVCESFAGGKLLYFTPHYWRDSAADTYRRMRHKARRIAETLESAGLLEKRGVGLAGWIEKRVTSGATSQIERLDYHGLLALIIGLTRYARSRDVQLEVDEGAEEQAGCAASGGVMAG